MKLARTFLALWAVHASGATAGFDNDLSGIRPGIKIPFGSVASFGLHLSVRQHSDTLQITTTLSQGFPCTIKRITLQLLGIADGGTRFIAEVPVAYKHGVAQFDISLDAIEYSSMIFECADSHGDAGRAYDLPLSEARRIDGAK